MDSTPDLSKYFKLLSARHHYIPRFLIDGFTNNEGLVYIYDKEKDKIIRKPRSPKSIFFEDHRNTIELAPGIRTSIIEDLLYKEMDNRTSKIIKRYQTEELTKIDFQIEDTAIFLFFLISLLWRIPKTDYAANDLMDRSIIKATGIDPEILRNDPTYRKMSRARLFQHHIAQMKAFGASGKKWINIHQNGHPIYVLGDYPILFRKQPSLFSEFNDTDILVAVSSKRIYSSTVNPVRNFQSENSLLYNACIIEQSVKYVACGNRTVLEQSILFYKKVKEAGLIYTLPEKVFQT